jgi:hypothetical protein
MRLQYETELYHHGVKGMHWGVRRYQNEDGTLTALGRKRLAQNSTMVLNNFDAERATSRRYARKYEKRLERAKRSGNEKRIARLQKKFDEATESYKKKEQEIHKIVDQLGQCGYDVAIKDIHRAAPTMGEAALALYTLNIAGIIPLALFTREKGKDYKVTATETPTTLLTPETKKMVKDITNKAGEISRARAAELARQQQQMMLQQQQQQMQQQIQLQNEMQQQMQMQIQQQIQDQIQNQIMMQSINQSMGMF